MTYIASLLLLLAFIAAAAVRADRPFIHPGVLLSGRQLSFVKAQVAANATPFADSLAKARANTFVNSRASAAMSPGWNGTISCGYFDSADYGCHNATNDGESALLQAYLWAVTGEAVWAARATARLTAAVLFMPLTTLLISVFKCTPGGAWAGSAIPCFGSDHTLMMLLVGTLLPFFFLFSLTRAILQILIDSG
jgi:hypothetical protein